MIQADVVVIGLGTAGAAVAALCSARGLSVIGLDRHALTHAGAHWVNGVPLRCFDEAEIPRPTGDELLAHGRPFHILVGHKPHRIIVRNHDLAEVDMRLLVNRLQQSAMTKGAHLYGEIHIHERSGNVLSTSMGPISGKTIVDASGMAGLNLLENIKLSAKHICVAAQEVRKVRDMRAAEAFFHDHGAVCGDTIAFTSIAGGYSVLNLRLHDDNVYILTGSVPADGVPSGKQMLETFVETHPWVGTKVYGGSRALPLGYPYAKIGIHPIAGVGDSVSQIYSVHGSGIGAGMIAARVLSEVLSEGGNAWDYAQRWQKQYGAFYATHDLIRRFTQDLSWSELEQWIDAGILTEASSRASLNQTWLEFEPMIKSLHLRSWSVSNAKKVALLGQKAIQLKELYRNYPNRVEDLPHWQQRLERIFYESSA